jgi:hypothetical protein
LNRCALQTNIFPNEEMLCGMGAESVTLTVNACAETAVMGVPEITPVLAFNVSPAGSDPEVSV